MLLASYYNIRNEPELKEKKIEDARKRAVNVLGGFCGFYGACGAAVGTGIFISVITEANPLSRDEWNKLKWDDLLKYRSDQPGIEDFVKELIQYAIKHNIMFMRLKDVYGKLYTNSQGDETND